MPPTNLKVTTSKVDSNAPPPPPPRDTAAAADDDDAGRESQGSSGGVPVWILGAGAGGGVVALVGIGVCVWRMLRTPRPVGERRATKPEQATRLTSFLITDDSWATLY